MTTLVSYYIYIDLVLYNLVLPKGNSLVESHNKTSASLVLYASIKKESKISIEVSNFEARQKSFGIFKLSPIHRYGATSLGVADLWPNSLTPGSCSFQCFVNLS